ncbi:M56 family metallopeptidase [Enhygromyxa salina]|uniref:Regulatory protein BlaR1 n=1 Tax=Enhygromyxa salina TaxID=215803 RepID=A0A2S9YS23_9BACT|nr:M56 family metallopeptidase [Enhygromyxa salina]PRQ07901.1 Regulatory protein BlaR1 [Enhygromyxa salina]
MTSWLGWLGMLQVVAAAVLGVAWITDRMIGARATAAQRRSMWALASLIVLSLPLARLAVPAPTPRVPLVIAWVGVGVWAAGASVLLLRWARGLASTRELIARATPIHSGPWHRSLSAANTPLAVTLAHAQGLPSPMLVGCLRPMILIPTELAHAPASERRAVLSHELAHLARADNLILQLAVLARAIYWVTPLAWWGLGRLTAEAENAADDAVLEAGVPPTSYAAQLVALARAQLDRAGRVGAGQLRGRVEAILDVDRRRGVLAGQRPRLAFAHLLGVAVLLASLTSACEARSDHRASSDAPLVRSR